MATTYPTDFTGSWQMTMGVDKYIRISPKSAQMSIQKLHPKFLSEFLSHFSEAMGSLIHDAGWLALKRQECKSEQSEFSVARVRGRKANPRVSYVSYRLDSILILLLLIQCFLASFRCLQGCILVLPHAFCWFWFLVVKEWIFHRVMMRVYIPSFASVDCGSIDDKAEEWQQKDDGGKCEIGTVHSCHSRESVPITPAFSRDASSTFDLWWFQAFRVGPSPCTSCRKHI